MQVQIKSAAFVLLLQGTKAFNLFNVAGVAASVFVPKRQRAVVEPILTLDDNTKIRDPRGCFAHKLDHFLDFHLGTNEPSTEFKPLAGNFAPVAREHKAVPIAVVEGAIPPGLDGLLVRNGPNQLQHNNPARRNPNKVGWLDGHGMIHSVRFRDGEATYSNSFVPTPRYKIEKAMGEPFFVPMSDFMAKGGWVSFLKAFAVEEQLCQEAGLKKSYESYQASYNVAMFANRCLCLCDTGYPFEVFLDESGGIEGSAGHTTFGGSIDLPVSGHSKIDPVSGNLMLSTYCHAGKGTTAEVSATSGKAKSRYVPHSENDSKWLLPGAVSVTHETVFTKNWAVMFDTPMRMDPVNLLKEGAPLVQWDDSHTQKISLVPRSSKGSAKESDVKRIDVGRNDGQFHVLNAWEESDGTVVIWAPITNKCDFNKYDGSHKEVDEEIPQMVEYRICSVTGTLKNRTQIDEVDFHIETPTVRSDRYGQYTDLAYTGVVAEGRENTGLLTGFLIWDVQKRKIKTTVSFEAGEFGGDISVMVVTESEAKNGEEKVYVGTHTYSTNTNESYVLLYDGTDGTQVARLKMPHRVPYGFHCQYIDGDTLDQHIKSHRGGRPNRQTTTFNRSINASSKR